MLICTRCKWSQSFAATDDHDGGFTCIYPRYLLPFQIEQLPVYVNPRDAYMIIKGKRVYGRWDCHMYKPKGI